MSSRFLVTVAAGAVFAAGVWAQGLVDMSACGREAKPGAAVCAHCAAALPKPGGAERAEAPPEMPAVDKNAEVARGAVAVVEDSLRQARELEKKQPEVALSYYQNALAVMRLVPAGALPAGAGDAILVGNDRMMQVLLRGQVPCRKCNGTGKYQLDLGKVDSKKGIKAVAGIACPACKGAGSFTGFRDVSKVKMAILQGRQEFERRQMVSGAVGVGRALVPSALDRLLSNRQRALVMTGMPVPCESCRVCGASDLCDVPGDWLVEVFYPGCDNGVLQEPRSTTGRKATRLGEEAAKKCPRCEGLAEVPCETCKGSANIVCKQCDGSGLAPRCTRCTGTGLMTCTKCKGAGEAKGSPCPDCKGETVSLCTTCRGEGALAR